MSARNRAAHRDPDGEFLVMIVEQFMPSRLDSACRAMRWHIGGRARADGRTVGVMKIENLLTLKCVVDERSYTRAAEQLYLTQPAVYQQVRQLDTEIGAKLTYVKGKEVLPTAVGRDVYAFACEVERCHQELTKRLEQHERSRRRIVRIGAASYFGATAQAAEQIRMRNTGIVIQFEHMRPPEAIGFIRSRDIDFGFFGASFLPDDLAADPCGENRIAVVVRHDHPLAGKTELSFADIQDYQFAGYASGSARLAIERWGAEHPEYQVQYAAQSTSSIALREMVLTMNIPGFIAIPAIQQDLLDGTLLRLDVQDFRASYTIYAVHIGRDELAPGPLAYLDELMRLRETGSGLQMRRTKPLEL